MFHDLIESNNLVQSTDLMTKMSKIALTWNEWTTATDNRY